MVTLPSRPRLLARAVLGACLAFLIVQEVRVVVFGGGSLGPLSSRGAHDVVLLAATLVCLARVRASHVRWDGAGYPDLLAGENIPLGARIVAVADAFDAMTSDRPYRTALPETDALAELRRCAGTQFDPAVVDAFCGACARSAVSV